ncbi:MAG: Pr6Pr family membrane protein [Micrococcales bacterium]
MLRKLSGGIQLAIAIAITIAITWQIADRVIAGYWRWEEYFSFVTIQMCIVTALVCYVTAYETFVTKRDTEWVSIARMCAVTYMMIVGIVYNLLLRNAPADPTSWDYDYVWPTPPNEILHVVAPTLLFIEWLLVAGSYRLKYRQLGWLWMYAIAWIIFTLVRGYSDGWWPYWFTDPDNASVNGWTGQAMYLSAILVFMVVIGFILITIEKGMLKLTKRK